MHRISLPILIIFLLTSAHATAQDDKLDALSQQLKALSESVKNLQSTVDKQQLEINTLKKENSKLKGPPTPSDPVRPTPQKVGDTLESDDVDESGNTRRPEIGVSLDMVGLFTESTEDINGNDRRSIRDLEIMIGGQVDPDLRLDSTINFSDIDDRVDIEEAYVTYSNLWFDVSTRVGRIRPNIGKANVVHRDQLDTADEPLVIQRLFGQKGLARTGFDLSREMIKIDDKFTQVLTLGIVEGGTGIDGELFGDLRRHPTSFGHFSNLLEFSPDTSLEIGGSFLAGSSGADLRNDVNAYGLDLTFIHKFDDVRRIKWLSEAYLQHRDDIVAEDEALGYYTLLDVRLTDNYGVGARYDNVERTFTTGEDEAYSLYVTLFRSKYALLRAQYQKIDFAEGGHDDLLFLQGTFAIGIHNHKMK